MQVIDVFLIYIRMTADYKTTRNKLFGNRVAGLDISEELFVNWLGKKRKKQTGFDSIYLKIEQKIVSFNSFVANNNRIEHINMLGFAPDFWQLKKLGKIT